jgi:26S proteasome regulatory subunit N1
MSQSEEVSKQTALASAGNEKTDKKEKVIEDLSEEDESLKEGLELAVTRLTDQDDSLHRPALDHLANEIRSATSSMTSVPKPLKFLRPHFSTLKQTFSDWPVSHPLKRSLADVLSVLAMTMGSPGERETLRFKLQGNKQDLSLWGHEYVRALSGEIAAEYAARYEHSAEEEPFIDDLLVLIEDIVPFQMTHNAEADACDLLLETSLLSKLQSGVVDERNFERVCLYLLRSASFVADPDDLHTLLVTAFTLYLQQNKRCDALRVALRMQCDDRVQSLFADPACSQCEKKQMALLLARHKSHILCGDEELDSLAGNAKLSEHFIAVANALDVASPKSPEDIYKLDVSQSIVPHLSLCVLRFMIIFMLFFPAEEENLGSGQCRQSQSQHCRDVRQCFCQCRTRTGLFIIGRK